MYKQH